MFYRKGWFRVSVVLLSLGVGFWFLWMSKWQRSNPPIRSFVSDKTSSSATVIWVTKRMDFNRLILIDDQAKYPILTLKILPDYYSNLNKISAVHMVKLKNLKEQHTYSLKVLGGIHLYDIGKLTTSRKNYRVPKLQPAFGMIEGKRKEKVKDVLIALYKSSNPQITVSTLTDNQGFWAANVADLNLKNGDKVIVEVLTPDGLIKKDINNGKYLRPAKLIKL